MADAIALLEMCEDSTLLSFEATTSYHSSAETTEHGDHLRARLAGEKLASDQLAADLRVRGEQQPDRTAVGWRAKRGTARSRKQEDTDLRVLASAEVCITRVGRSST